MNRMLVVAALALGLIAGGARAAEANKNVYWDVTHGTYLSYNIAGSYSQLAAQLTGTGYTLTEVSTGIDTVNLAGVDIVVVAVTNAWNSAYTPSEVAALQQFVNFGGSLFILSDEVGIPASANVQPVATAFGAACGQDTSGNASTVWTSHPIAAGVTSVTHFASGRCTVTAPMTAVGSDTGGRVVEAAGQFGVGRVVIVGDVNSFINGTLGTGNDALFAQNAFDWLNAANPCTASASVTTEPAGANCAEGGARIQSYCDLDGDGQVDAGEVVSTAYACDGADGLGSVIATSVEPPGANCADGGVRVDSGADTDADGTLDASEITDTTYVCNGSDGTDGTDALVVTTAEPPGANCADGGVRVDSGLDDDGDGVLAPSEIDSTEYVCNGGDGSDGTDGTDGASALVSTSEEPAGDNCAAGGTRIDVGVDADSDGTLSASEITDTSFVCNGADGSGGCNAGGGAGAFTLVLVGGALLALRRRR
jgi:uncharacterized protein (TIGR03382 family)